MTYVARNKYQLPISLDKLVSIDTHSSPAHFGKLENAVDFVASENTISTSRSSWNSHVR